MERNYAIDFFKFFAILAVVIIHTFPSDHKLGYFVLDNLSRFAVPFFFAASGYLFGIKVGNSPKPLLYFKKYEIKILKIYICWLLFYIFYDVLRIIFSGGNDKELLKYFEELTWVNLIYYGQGTSGYQLWFVISLAWSIAALFLFFKLKKITLLLVIALCFNIAGVFGQSYAIFFEIPLTTRDALFIGLFYTTVGFWFSSASHLLLTYKMTNKTIVYWLSFFIILQFIEGYWLEEILSAKHGEYFLSTIFLTVFLFLLTLNNPHLGKGLWITKIGGNALGIYAIHVLFIDLVDNWLNSFGLGHVSHNIMWNILDAFLVFTLAYLTYYYLQVIKTRLSV